MVDVREALRESISEVLRDHKDGLEAQRTSQKWGMSTCVLEDKGDT